MNKSLNDLIDELNNAHRNLQTLSYQYDKDAKCFTLPGTDIISVVNHINASKRKVIQLCNQIKRKVKE